MQFLTHLFPRANPKAPLISPSPKILGTPPAIGGKETINHPPA